MSVIERGKTIMFRAVGFAFLSDRPPLEYAEDYNDWTTYSASYGQVCSDIQRRALTPGLMLQAENGYCGVIVPGPDGLEIVPLAEWLRKRGTV